MLETIDLTLAMDRETYVQEVTRRQIQLRELGYLVYKVFETIIAGIEMRLGANAPPRKEPATAALKDADLREAMESLSKGGR